MATLTLKKMTEERRKLTISEVNGLTYDHFIRQFAEVVDNCVFLAAAVWRYRPFASLDHLQKVFCDFMADLPPAGKEAILRLMPDVTGKSAQGISLGKESISERASASLDQLTQAEIDIMTTLNDSYTKRFGFHFVLCARENEKIAFLEDLKTRLRNSPEVEVVVGVGEVKKICRLRLKDLVEDKEQMLYLSQWFPDVEAAVGVGEVKKICRLRLKDLVEDSISVKSDL